MQDGSILRGRYQLERLLGRGGMAEVYLALDALRQARVAVKVLREDLAEDPQFLERFQREAEALARLDHPNVVRFYSFERQGGTAFIVMDYVPGATLRGRLAERGGPLPLEEVSRILPQVAAALHYAHSQGYIHRDIKPGNIMLKEDGTALLSDFGIARAAEVATMTLGPLGTPAYMSPEQILGHEVDARTDVYSLGVVLYEMVAGRRPFTGETGTGTATNERIRNEHLHLAPPDPRHFNPGLPAAAAQVILRTLAKDPAQRWPDVMSLARAWSEATRQGQAASAPLTVPARTAPARPAPPPAQPGQQSRWPLWVALLALAGLLAVVAGCAVVVLGTPKDGSASPTALALAESQTADATATATAAAPTDTPQSPLATATPAPSATATGEATGTPVSGSLAATATPESPPAPPTPSPAAPTATDTAAGPTPTATLTPAPPTPTATLTPAPPTPTAECPQAVAGFLYAAWDRAELGCPTSWANTVWAAYQPFEGGYLFWRSDTDRVTVLYGDGSWEERHEQWDGVSPIPSRGEPPAGRLAPERGFGYIWGSVDHVANGLGWATDTERGFCADIQPFEGGFILRANRSGPCQADLFNWATDPTFPDLFFSAANGGAWRWSYQ